MNVFPLLASQFPEFAIEIPSLTSLHNSHKRCTAYKSFRQLVILSAVAESLGFTVQTRQMDAAITLSACDNTPFTMLDVYEWIGIKERTFANHKSDLQKAYADVQKLEKLAVTGHANPALLTKWECWYPYTLPCEAYWKESDFKRYPALQWRWKDFGTELYELHNLLLVVPLLSPTYV